MNYLEIAHAAFSYPQQLAEILRRPQSMRSFYLLSLSAVSVSIAVGQYLLRDYYHGYYKAELPVLIIFLFIFFILWSVLNGSLIDAVALYIKKERKSHPFTIINSIGFALIPFIFFSPGAGLIKNTAYQSIFLLALTIFLCGWSIYSFIRTIQFFYEISFREALRLFIITQLILYIFPLLFVFFLMSFAVSLVF